MSEPNIIEILSKASGIPDGDELTTIAASLGQAFNGNLEHKGLWKRALDGILAGTAGPGQRPEPKAPAPQCSRQPDPRTTLPPSIFKRR